jgi:hypothetical protein
VTLEVGEFYEIILGISRLLKIGQKLWAFARRPACILAHVFRII